MIPHELRAALIALSKKAQAEEHVFDEYRAARYIGMSVWFLRSVRKGKSRGPQHFHIGRSVRYRKQVLDRYIADQEAKERSA